MSLDEKELALFNAVDRMIDIPMATRLNHLEELVANGVNINAKDGRSLTPLARAASREGRL